MHETLLILGGARSGKSARALTLAAEPPHVFVATAEALDAEMADRIARHRAERGDSWQVVEEPLDLAGAIAAHAAEGTTILVDCLTLWLSNLMHHGRDPEAETARLVAAIEAAPGRIVLVSNEIGLGLAPMNELGRAFRDAQGRLNQRIAAVADHVEFVAAGLPLTLKGGPR
ncbi:bifunctional adenosylcobinamide kinase/adenosylcobinamide-phosphate guanylyltransferase [Limibaculum sp. M0105]|uniref:Bifunctional adenosylcobalamin biosynthesis protein n=1 Tax=Thermohalobaculum xanthum TaxID=2753746 RepID=A0A8J7M446_9RHOB|nr:bifunctional adenosylcobinamide kinase/adenosylcobinamide-phosphate guanylyltransferase [Thermohalobaculum xanthum]MBK0397834.1 bifunctional adenosylcobinamide kinase/adenosylcobinamide-phosphate guanylyltransferase [Thermohalobaculum xanthum]